MQYYLVEANLNSFERAQRLSNRHVKFQSTSPHLSQNTREFVINSNAFPPLTFPSW